MTSTSLTTRVIQARRYIELFRRYRARPMSFTSRKLAFYRSYWTYAAKRIGADLEDLGGGLLRISRKGRSTHVRYHHVDLDTYFNKYLMDDKHFVNRLVLDLGFLTPRQVQYSLSEMETAQFFLDNAAGPCVVKPVGESGGRGITTRITRRERLVRASLAASASFSLPRLMLEAEYAGDCFRLLYLDGCLLHAVKRGRPTVVGDGVSTVRELVKHENRRRQSESVVQSLSELTVDLEMAYTLADQRLTLNSVPAADERVIVKNVSNQNCRRDQAAMGDKVHADYHELAAKLHGKLGTHLIGIDVMSTDISKAPDEFSSVVLEVNIPPGLHYHELVPDGPGFSEVGSAVLRYVLGKKSAFAWEAGGAATQTPAREELLQK